MLCTESGTRRFWACPRGPRRPLFPPADSGDARGGPWGPLGAFPASWPLAPQPGPHWRLAASVGSQPGRRSRVRFVACMFPSSLFFLPFSFLLSRPLLSPSPLSLAWRWRSLASRWRHNPRSRAGPRGDLATSRESRARPRGGDLYSIARKLVSRSRPARIARAAGSLAVSAKL